MSRTIHRVAVVVGLVVALIGAGARSRLFGTGLGKYALSADECRSGKLMQRQGGTRLSVGGICTKDCSTNSDCGDGLRCYQGDCAPLASKALGQACEAPWDCQSDICAAIVPMLAGLGNANIRADDPPAQTICMQGCANGEACPAGEACTDMPGAGMLCAKHRDGEDSGADLLNLLQELRNRSGGGNTP